MLGSQGHFQNSVCWIASRLDRLAYGHAGDAAPVGEGISEVRIHYGPNCRMHFHQRRNTVVMLLRGGNKDTQTRDITNGQTAGQGMDGLKCGKTLDA
jgi:putative addiction module killer protein